MKWGKLHYLSLSHYRLGREIQWIYARCCPSKYCPTVYTRDRTRDFLEWAFWGVFRNWLSPFLIEGELFKFSLLFFSQFSSESLWIICCFKSPFYSLHVNLQLWSLLIHLSLIYVLVNHKMASGRQHSYPMSYLILSSSINL